MIPFMLVHALICILLVIVILMQSGRRGGLTESMAAAESLFGAQTNAFMIKTTTILATFFLVTCLGLAFFSSKQNKSLMSSRGAVGTIPKAAGLPLEQPSAAAPTTPTPETAPAAPSVDQGPDTTPVPSAVDPASATQ